MDCLQLGSPYTGVNEVDGIPTPGGQELQRLEPLGFRTYRQARYENGGGSTSSGLVNRNPYGKSYLPLDNLTNRGLELNTSEPWFIGFKFQIDPPPEVEAKHICYISTLPSPSPLDPWIATAFNVGISGAWTANRGDTGWPPDGGSIEAVGTVLWASGDYIVGALGWGPTVGLHYVGYIKRADDSSKGYWDLSDSSAAAKTLSNVGTQKGQFVVLDEWYKEGVTGGHTTGPYHHLTIGNGGTGSLYSHPAIPTPWWTINEISPTAIAGKSIFAWNFREGDLVGKQISS